MKKFPWKWGTFILLVICVIREWRRGYFLSLRTFFESLSLRPYWKLLLSFSLYTALLAALADVPLHQWIRTLNDPWVVQLNQLGRVLGRKSNPWIFALILYFLFAAFKKNRASQVVFGALFANALTVGVTNILKYTFLRARPETALGHLSFFNWKGWMPHGNNFLSFCSGDVASVAGLAGFFFYYFKDSSWRWFFPLLPVLNAFSRIYLNNHWPSDTFFALGLGFLFGRLLAEYDRWLVQRPERRVTS